MKTKTEEHYVLTKGDVKIKLCINDVNNTISWERIGFSINGLSRKFPDSKAMRNAAQVYFFRRKNEGYQIKEDVKNA